MRIHLLCVGRRMPGWVDTGYQEYAKRMPAECALRLVQIDPGHRGKAASPQVARRLEGERMLAAVPKGALVAGFMSLDHIIIPSGDTVIAPYDSFIIVARREVFALVVKILAVMLVFF